MKAVTCQNVHTYTLYVLNDEGKRQAADAKDQTQERKKKKLKEQMGKAKHGR